MSAPAAKSHTWNNVNKGRDSYSGIEFRSIVGVASPGTKTGDADRRSPQAFPTTELSISPEELARYGGCEMRAPGPTTDIKITRLLRGCRNSEAERAASARSYSKAQTPTHSGQPVRIPPPGPTLRPHRLPAPCLAVLVRPPYSRPGEFGGLLRIVLSGGIMLSPDHHP